MAASTRILVEVLIIMLHRVLVGQDCLAALSAWFAQVATEALLAIWFVFLTALEILMIIGMDSSIITMWQFFLTFHTAEAVIVVMLV